MNNKRFNRDVVKISTIGKEVEEDIEGEEEGEKQV